jgi:hypothetical protein
MNCYQTDVLEMGPLRGRREITLQLARTLRGQAKQLAAMLADTDHKRLARSIERTAGTLERLAQLPADPSSDYRGG